jgi:small conductance mechanosensitive channel
MKPVQFTAANMYDKIADWGFDNGPRLLLGIVAFFLGQWLIRICRNWLQKTLRRRAIDSSLRPFFHSLLITGMQVMLVFTVMQIIGIQMTVFAAVTASLGVAAGLALSGTLQNFTSGILILMLKPFRVGDNVIAQGQDGIVTSIQTFYTIITTSDKKAVIIPNSKLSNEVIINLSREGGRRLDIEMKFGYAFDMDRIREVMRESARQLPGLLGSPQPEAGISSVEADGYKVLVQAWVDPLKFNEMKIVLNQKLLEGLKRAGVKLPGMAA